MNENGVSTSNEYNKGDYRVVGTVGKSANQVEFVLGKDTTFQNGVWSKLGVRAEYGNGDHYLYSSSGSEDKGNDGNFEVKEAFIQLGGMSYLPEDAHIWAGRRFLNREASNLSGEFWKQSSGVGFGYEMNSDDKTHGVALVSVDVGEGTKTKGKTIHSMDFYSYNHQALGGSFNFDTKIMRAGDKSNFSKKEADDGLGLAVTYKRDFYGFDGWSATALAFGKGLAANRGVNFGQWSGGTSTTDSENGESIFFTSYGMMNINSTWQLMTELTYLHGREIWSLPDGGTVDRMLVAARPTYKVNDNFRWEFTASMSREKADWNQEDKTKNSQAAEIAAVFSVNSDFYGRPQIKPFVTFMRTDAKDGWGDEFGKDKNTYQYGVEAEIWF